MALCWVWNLVSNSVIINQTSVLCFWGPNKLKTIHAQARTPWLPASRAWVGSKWPKERALSVSKGKNKKASTMTRKKLFERDVRLLWFLIFVLTVRGRDVLSSWPWLVQQGLQSCWVHFLFFSRTWSSFPSLDRPPTLLSFVSLPPKNMTQKKKRESARSLFSLGGPLRRGHFDESLSVVWTLENKW